MQQWYRIIWGNIREDNDMKINFIAPAVGNSGGMQVVFKYAIELEKRGHEVFVYAPIIPYVLQKKSFIYKCAYVIPRVVHNIYKFKVKNYPHQLCENVKWKIVPMINDRFVSHADVVIATAWPTAYDVAKLSIKKGKKFYFIQDYEVWDDKDKGEASYKLNLNKIVIADWIKKRIADLGIDTSKIPTVNNGIDYSVYERKRSYNNSEEFRFLILDHHLEKKGVKYGIEVYEKIKNRFPKVTLKMFGMKRSAFVPDYAEYYENPTRAELVNLYNESDIFLFPSIEEGWGLTVIEAMASGCAIVGTNTGCLLEIGKDKCNCMKSNPKDVDSMVENVIEIMKNDKLFFKLVQQGKETAKNLDWNKSVVQFEKAISFYR